VVGTGFCGALTTWSTASWETVRLIEEGAARSALAFTVYNLLASFAAGAVGLVVFVR
jgi:CrcB protein